MYMLERLTLQYGGHNPVGQWSLNMLKQVQERGPFQLTGRCLGLSAPSGLIPFADIPAFMAVLRDNGFAA